MPLRSRITVTESPPAELRYTLIPAPFELPPIVTEVHRSGIYGAVGDTSHHPLGGVLVQAAGVYGGKVLTESLGGFAFPRADRGPYLLRFTRAGYGERRLMVELKPGDGREVVVVMTGSRFLASRADERARGASVTFLDCSRKSDAATPRRP